MSELGITIQGQSFPHLIYHLVLTYSNWESATVVFRRASKVCVKDFKMRFWNLGKCRSGTEPIGCRRR
jgi:hypothetical protein